MIVVKTRKGKDVSIGPSNFIKSDYIEIRLEKIEERLAKLERMVESIIPQPFYFQPRFISKPKKFR